MNEDYNPLPIPQPWEIVNLTNEWRTVKGCTNAQLGCLLGHIATAEQILRELQPYVDSLVCYASTINEHLPNGFQKRIDAVLGSPAQRETDHG